MTARYEVHAWDHEVEEWAPRKGMIRERRREWVIVDTVTGRVVESSDARWPMDSAAACYNEGIPAPTVYAHMAARHPGRMRTQHSCPWRLG